MSRPFVADWREKVRNSDLSVTVKAVAWCLSLYMNRDGHAFPSRDALASGCSLSDRAVDHALDRLEANGWLTIEPKKRLAKGGKLQRPGGKQATNRYQATLPETVNVVRPIAAQTANHVRPMGLRDGEPGSPYQRPKGERRSVKGERGSPEQEEQVKAREAPTWVDEMTEAIRR